MSAIAALAVIDAVRGRGEERPPQPEQSETVRAADVRARPLRGRVAPPPQALPGELYVAALPDCRLREVDLADVALGPQGPPTLCGLWAAHSGGLVVVPVRRRAGSSATIELWLARFRDRPKLLRPLAVARGTPSWSPESRRFAWCRPDGTTAVLTLASGRRRLLPGCRPRFTSAGAVLTRPDRPLVGRVLWDGRAVLEESDLERGFAGVATGSINVLDYAARGDGLLAVVAVRFPNGSVPRTRLQFWRGRVLEASLPLETIRDPNMPGQFAEAIAFSPDGRELALALPRSGIPLVVVDVAARKVVLARKSQHGVDWSRDSVWLAVSTGERVLVYGLDRSAPVYALPVRAAALAWR